MNTIVRNLILTVLALALFTWAIFPPEEKLRLGKDLRGGVSLVYSVQINPNEDARDTMAKTIDVYKERIDPQGLYEISFLVQGRDRLEITMPLPGPEVKKLRAEYEAELEKLGKSSISDAELQGALRAAPEERSARFAQLADGNPALLKLLEEAAAATQRAEVAKRALEEATAAGAVEQDELLTAATDADLAADKARGAVLRATIPPEEIRRALRLPAEKPTLFDGKSRTSVEFPSPREEALNRIREQHPEATQQLDAVLAKYQAYASKRKTLDDPQDLVRLMRDAGVLSFRITVNPGFNPVEEQRLRQELRERGPQNVRSPDMHWYKLNSLDKWHNNDLETAEKMRANPQAFFRDMSYIVDEYDGEYYMLCWDTASTRLTQSEGGWGVSRAFESHDSFGKPSIAFQMNPRGGVLLGELTKQHVGQKMAVLLDDQVYTAPNLQSEIKRDGQISGNFTKTEINYIVRVLSSGSLQSKISPEPISTSILGPELGADNLRLGMRAGMISFIVVTIFMLVYYFTCGAIAVFALLVTGVMILGCMALAKAAFTMPGIAGIILTFGQAIDSNVLIYERMREELRRGKDMKSAVRLGFDKAMSSIVDGNVTNLIVCFVLGFVGTPEVKGFAITMGIGIVATLFCALVVSRLILDVAVVHLGWRKTSMLPMAIPAVQEFLTWKTNWIRLRGIFVTISVVLVSVGIVMFALRGEKMLDTEFLGGTQVTLKFKEGADGQPMVLTRAQAQDKVVEIGNRAPDGDTLRPLQAAEVSPVNPREDGVTSDQFIVKTTVTDKDAVLNALTGAFAEYLESQPPLAFQGSELTDWKRAPVYRVLSARLGDNIDRPNVADNVASRIGGIAIVLSDIRDAQSGKRPTLAALEQRLEAMRGQPAYSDTFGRVREVRAIDGTPEEVKTAVLIVQDPTLSFLTSEGRFDAEVAAREWNLSVEALTRSMSPASVQSFSPAVAGTFKALAIIATLLSFALITLYVWFRFKSFRYGFASIVALLHDVLGVMGLLALCGWLYENPATATFAAKLGILPFKIDLNMVAALLTVAGFSLNDTIIIMDRIRENRGKMPYTSASMINNAINQTISRTIITSGTTLMSSITLYVAGGEGVRAFAFALTMGVIVGTYSSVAVAAPIIWSRREELKFAAKDSTDLAPASA
ncbi:MAG TPA: protein translocase subunit SecD [Phycisphaerales bacterium]|nr:protein translocase subunit SecD [Phycisphaerales bacterium]